MMDRKRAFAVKNCILIFVVMFSIYVTSNSRIFSNFSPNNDAEEKGEGMEEAISENRKRILLMQKACENYNRIFASPLPSDTLHYPLTQYPLSSLLYPQGWTCSNWIKHTK